MKRSRKWWFLILMMLVLLLSGIAWGRIARYSRVKSLLMGLMEREASVCTVRIRTGDWEADLEISWMTVLDNRCYSIDAGSENLYFIDGALYFDNGTGYELKGLWEALDLPLSQAWKLLLLAEIEFSEQDSRVGWKVTFPEKALPLVGEYADIFRSLQLFLSEESGMLKALSVSHDRFRLEMERHDSSPTPIPTELLMEMGTGSLPDIRTLKPLLHACIGLIKKNSVQGDVLIQANCGPLSLEDTGQFILSGEGLSFDRDNRLANLIPEPVDRTALILGGCWMLLREGIWTPDGSEGGSFSVSIPGGNLKTAIQTVLPELEGLDLSMDRGTFLIRVTEGTFSQMTLSCSGELPFFITTVPLSIQAEVSING